MSKRKPKTTEQLTKDAIASIDENLERPDDMVVVIPAPDPVILSDPVPGDPGEPEAAPAAEAAAMPTLVHTKRLRGKAKTPRDAKGRILPKKKKAPKEPPPSITWNRGAAKTPKKAKAPKARPAKGERKPSLLTLAYEILKRRKNPMSSTEMAVAVLERGEWKTKGKTPEATLYAAIIREIAAKGKDARFRKVDRNSFEAA